MFNEVSKEYPEVKTYSYLVDAASMFFVLDPKRFEIVERLLVEGTVLTPDMKGKASTSEVGDQIIHILRERS